MVGLTTRKPSIGPKVNPSREQHSLIPTDRVTSVFGAVFRGVPFQVRLRTPCWMTHS